VTANQLRRGLARIGNRNGVRKNVTVVGRIGLIRDVDRFGSDTDVVGIGGHGQRFTQRVVYARNPRTR